MRCLAGLLALFAGLAFCAPVHGQVTSQCPPLDSSSARGAIVGQVLDAESGIPLIAQVRLTVQGVSGTLETRSDGSGRFQFCSVRSGIFTIIGQFGQLGTHLGPLALGAGETISLSLELSHIMRAEDSGTLTGLILDADSEEPVEGATVVLPGLRRMVSTNSLGRFTIPSLPPGTVAMEVTRLGYAEVDGEVSIEPGETTETRITMATEAIPLDPITVVAIRQRIDLAGMDDFERRYHSGWGQFILQDEIQRRMPNKLTQMLYETGVQVANDGRAIYMRRTGCGPMVYIDGIKVTHMSRSKSLMGAYGGARTTAIPFNPLIRQGARARFLGNENPATEAADAVNNLVHPMDVVAVEIYRGPAETPGQYLDSNAQCGVILIWTRRGNISGR